MQISADIRVYVAFFYVLCQKPRYFKTFLQVLIFCFLTDFEMYFLADVISLLTVFLLEKQWGMQIFLNFSVLLHKISFCKMSEISDKS